MIFSTIRQTWYCRSISLCLMVTFVATMVITPRASYAQKGVMGLPQPGTMVNLSPAYVPLMLTGLRVHSENPLLMDFIVSTGNSDFNTDQVKKESDRLIKYFLSCLTIPEKDQWVNLSPYEKERIVPDDLGQTVLGQDMLEQDYILKQLTASLIYPEKSLGKNFWDKVYAKANQMYGTTQIPVNTFNKVWILPEYAKVYEHKDTVLVVKSHLKVMLDEDYLALSKHTPTRGHVPLTEGKGYVSPSTLASQIVRQIILPAIEQEVNKGQNFAQLRQIYNSMILAVWFKNNLKQAFLNQVYTDKSKVNGVNVDDPVIKEKIYKQYLEAYKKGVFNYIKEDPTVSKGPIASTSITSVSLRGTSETSDEAISKRTTIARKYFSGGLVHPDMSMIGAVGEQEAMNDLGEGPAANKFLLIHSQASGLPKESRGVSKESTGNGFDTAMLTQEVKAVTTRLGWTNVNINFGTLAQGRNIKVESGKDYGNRDYIELKNEDNNQKLRISRNDDVEEGAEINKELKSVKVSSIRIGDYSYRIGLVPINLRNQWLGNNALLKFLDLSPEGMSRFNSENDIREGHLSDLQYRFNLINDPPSRVVGSPLVSEIPSEEAVSRASTYLNSRTYTADAQQAEKLAFLHHLTILSRTAVKEGQQGKYAEVIQNRLLATAKLLEAAEKEKIGSLYAQMIQDIMWSSGILCVKADGQKAAPLEATLEAKVNSETHFTIDKPEDFESVGKSFEAIVRAGKITPYAIINIKNYAPDQYIAYLGAAREISRKYNGNITFIISPEVQGTLANDLPGASTALRRTADVLGKEFFDQNHVVVITDGGSKTRGGPITQVNHGQFSLATLARKVKTEKGIEVEVTNFLEMNLKTVGATWLQMAGHYGRNVLLWPASDGIIKFGAHPRFGSLENTLDKLPLRFLSASGVGLDLFAPEDAKVINKFATDNKVSIQELVEPDELFLRQHIAQNIKIITEADINQHRAKFEAGKAPPMVVSINPDELAKVKGVRDEFVKKYGTVADANSVVGRAFKEVYDYIDNKLVDKGNFITNDSTGKLITFVEKPRFAELAQKSILLGNGTDTMNIFYVMMDKQTAWDLFIKTFAKERNNANQPIGQMIVSVFDKVFGGLTKEDATHPISKATIEYINPNKVQALGINYGKGSVGGDIGNLDLNAKMFQALVADRDIGFDQRRNKDSVVIPSNVDVYYGPVKKLPDGSVKGTKLDDLAEQDRARALFLFKNVKIETDDPNVRYSLILGEASGIISSVIKFSKNGLKELDLTRGSIIVDSEIDGQVVFNGEYALLEGVTHTPSKVPTYDYTVDPDTGRIISKLSSTSILDVYGDETTVTIFIRQEDGSDHNVVVRSWNLDYKSPVGSVGIGSGGLPIGIMSVIFYANLSSSPETSFFTKTLSIEEAGTRNLNAQFLAYRHLASIHPRLLGVTDVSQWLLGQVLKKDEKTGKVKTVTLYDLPNYAGMTFEESKAKIDATRQRDHLTYVRGAWEGALPPAVNPAGQPDVAMITFDQAVKKLGEVGWQHLLDKWALLGVEQRKRVLEQIASIDWKEAKRIHDQVIVPGVPEVKPPQEFEVPVKKIGAADEQAARQAGREVLQAYKTDPKKSKFAVILAAGGTGSEFRSDNPKGYLPGTPLSQIQLYTGMVKKIQAAAKYYGHNKSFPIVVMPSDITGKKTIKFFKDNKWFEMPNRIFNSEQGVIPLFDAKTNEPFLNEKGEIATGATGHGDTFDDILVRPDVSKFLDDLGVEVVQYMAVDNQLNPIADERLIGYGQMTWDPDSKDPRAHIALGVIKKKDRNDRLANQIFVNGQWVTIGYGNATERIKDTVTEGDPSFRVVWRQSLKGSLPTPWRIDIKKAKDFQGNEIIVKKAERASDDKPRRAEGPLVELNREDTFEPIKKPDAVATVENVATSYLAQSNYWKRRVQASVGNLSGVDITKDDHIAFEIAAQEAFYMSDEELAKKMRETGIASQIAAWLLSLKPYELGGILITEDWKVQFIDKNDPRLYFLNWQKSMIDSPVAPNVDPNIHHGKTVLITGGAGYVASGVIYELLQNGSNVVIYDNMITPHRRKQLDKIQAAYPGRVTVIQGNLESKDLLVKVMKDNHVDSVVHLAAYIASGVSVNLPASYYNNNVVGTLNVLDAMREANVKNLSFASSAGVFQGKKFNKYGMLDEKVPVNPQSPYGDTKYLMEVLMQSYAQEHNINFSALRFFNLAGAFYWEEIKEWVGEGHLGPETHLIPRLIKYFLYGKEKVPFKIFGNDYPTPDGTNIRDYIHVLDIGHAILKSLSLSYQAQKDGTKVHEAFTLGTGTATSNDQIVDTFRNILSQDQRGKLIVEYGPRRPGDPPALRASSENATKRLAWRGTRALSDILKAAYSYHIQEQKEGSLNLQEPFPEEMTGFSEAEYREKVLTDIAGNTLTGEIKAEILLRLLVRSISYEAKDVINSFTGNREEMKALFVNIAEKEDGLFDVISMKGFVPAIVEKKEIVARLIKFINDNSVAKNFSDDPNDSRSHIAQALGELIQNIKQPSDAALMSDLVTKIINGIQPKETHFVPFTVVYTANVLYFQSSNQTYTFISDLIGDQLSIELYKGIGDKEKLYSMTTPDHSYYNTHNPVDLLKLMLANLEQDEFLKGVSEGYNTDSILKPDAIDKLSEVTERITNAGFEVMASSPIMLTPEQVREFYGIHQGKPFVETQLGPYMTEGPVILLFIKGKDNQAALRFRSFAKDVLRPLLGATNEDKIHTKIHAGDPEDAEKGFGPVYETKVLFKVLADQAMKGPGGIDLNSRNLNLQSEGQKVDITFDAAMIAQFKRGDFSGVKIQILDIVPINLMPLLGMKEDEGAGQLAKA